MIINEALIDLNTALDTKEAVIRHLAGLAKKEGRISDLEKYVEAALHRETEYSTAMGFGIAIPHGKTSAVTEPFLCFAKVDSVDWNALDGNPVDLVFMIGVPEEAGTAHLKILASISRKLMKQDFRDSLRNVTSNSELIQLLQNSDLGI
ncbi:MAG TPA: PTS transporter subunit EIIA [Clostridiales bacterium]|nr:PTS transporter subunit EIIA [Clostridiales bacterium]